MNKPVRQILETSHAKASIVPYGLRISLVKSPFLGHYARENSFLSIFVPFLLSIACLGVAVLVLLFVGFPVFIFFMMVAELQNQPLSLSCPAYMASLCHAMCALYCKTFICGTPHK